MIIQTAQACSLAAVRRPCAVLVAGEDLEAVALRGVAVERRAAAGDEDRGHRLRRRRGDDVAQAGGALVDRGDVQRAAVRR